MQPLTKVLMGPRRLDKVVAAAVKYGIKLVLTLANNWNPERQTFAIAWNRRWNDGELPWRYLSKDYGMYHCSFPACGSLRYFWAEWTRMFGHSILAVLMICSTPTRPLSTPSKTILLVWYLDTLRAQ